MNTEIEEIRKQLSQRGFITNPYKYNSQYAAIPDELLLDFIRLRLNNEGWGAPIKTLKIIEKRDKHGEYFYLKYVINENMAFGHISGIMFKKFYTNEIDWLSECMELLHYLPISEYIFRKNSEIINLECSDRGWRNAAKGWKETLDSLSKSISI